LRKKSRLVPQPPTIGNVTSASNHLTAFKEQTVIKILNARLVSEFKLEIDFSDHTQGVFDAGTYQYRQPTLLAQGTMYDTRGHLESHA